MGVHFPWVEDAEDVRSIQICTVLTTEMVDSENENEMHIQNQSKEISSSSSIEEHHSALHSSIINDEVSGHAQKSISTQIPLARIRRIMKEDEDMGLCSSEVVTIISMATELFSEYLAKKAFEYSKRDKRKTLLLRDIARAVKETDDLFFLTDAMVELITSIEMHKKEKSVSDSILNEEEHEDMQNPD